LKKKEIILKEKKMESDNSENNDYKERLENVKKITNLLIDFGKEFSIKYWESGEGVDIIINEVDDDGYLKYPQVISLNDNGYLKFEKQEQDGQN
jgi:hypothetical protein